MPTSREVDRDGRVTRDAAWVRRQRLLAQGLGTPTARTPVDAVRRLTAVQSQEPGHAFWSLALRSTATTEAEVRAAYDAGAFVRTHVLRPTWHLLAAEDVRWVLATTADRVHRTNASMNRSLGLDPAALDRGAGALAAALADGRPRTRPELAAVLADAGLPSTGVALASLVMHAELEQVVVSGPMRDGAHTHVLLDGRVPRTPVDGPDPARLLRRYLLGHGPVSPRDFARWSSLTLTAARQALATVLETHDDVRTVQVEGETYAHVEPAGDEPPGTPPPVLLLPLYDELPLAYTGLAFPQVGGHPRPPGTDVFVGSVVAGDANLGTWRRQVRGRRVEVALDLGPEVPLALRDLARAEAGRLARFLGRDLDLR